MTEKVETTWKSIIYSCGKIFLSLQLQFFINIHIHQRLSSPTNSPESLLQLGVKKNVIIRNLQKKSFALTEKRGPHWKMQT